MLALVEADLGPALARRVARHLVVFMQRPGGQAQFSIRLRANPVEHSSLRAVLDAIAEDPAADPASPPSAIAPASASATWCRSSPASWG